MKSRRAGTPVMWRAEVLTPTLVGDGRRLAPIDYMVWKEQVNVLDQALILRKLAGTPRLEGYLQQLRLARRLEFKDWGGYAQSYASRRIPLEHPSLVALYERARDEDTFIPTFHAGPHGRLLPASALKGALRTALMGSDLANALRLGDSRPAPTGPFRVYYSQVAMPARPSGPELRWKPGSVFAELAPPGTVFEGVGSIAGDPLDLAQKTRTWTSEVLDRQQSFAATHKLDAVSRALNAVSGDGFLLNIGWGGGFPTKSLAFGPRLDRHRPLLERDPAYSGPLNSAFRFPKSQRLIHLDGAPGTVPGWIHLTLAARSEASDISEA